MDDLQYLIEAYKVALKESTDPSTKNGAILVSDNGEILCSAANYFPRGVKETKARWTRPTKYDFAEHAERGVIYEAARQGIKTEGLTMYCPFYACVDCGRAIIQSGIKKVIGHDIGLEAHNQWKQSVATALMMFDEAGIEYKNVAGKLGLSILRNDSYVEV